MGVTFLFFLQIRNAAAPSSASPTTDPIAIPAIAPAERPVPSPPPVYVFVAAGVVEDDEVVVVADVDEADGVHATVWIDEAAARVEASAVPARHATPNESPGPVSF